MLERLATWFLNTYVAEYVGNLNTDQLSIGLLKGAVELEKLTLKRDALKKLRLPIEIKAGYIGKLRLQIPVVYIKSQPWVIKVDQLYLIAGPCDASSFSSEEEEASAARTKKLAKLAALEQAWREEQQKGRSSWFWSSFASSFSSTVAENLQVEFNDIHIRYEDDNVSGLTQPLVVGALIEQVAIQSTNNNWEPSFTTGTDKSYKLADLCNLSIYWDTEMLAGLEADKLMTAFLHKRAQVVSSADMMTSSMFSASTTSSSFIVKPVSAQARITRNCSSSPLRISDGPRVKVKVRVEEVPVVISEEQCYAFVKLSSTVAMRTLSQRYSRWRPTSSVYESPREWWKFAISVILRDIRERTGRLSCQFIMRRARQCVSYVDIYTLHLTNASLMAEDKDEMEKIEEELSYEELAILRKVAMQRVDQQLDHSGTESGSQGLVQRWFPGWVSGYYSQTDQGIAQEVAGPPVDEEELLDELGLEEDGNSKLLRDRIFAVVSFSLERGVIQLVPSGTPHSALGQEPILELVVSDLFSHVDYRPRLRYSQYELSLGSVCVQDYMLDQLESPFHVLVKPKELATVSPQEQPPSSSPPSYLSSPSSSSSSTSSSLLNIHFLQKQVDHHTTHTLQVTMRPLEIVYNRPLVARMKQFFLLDHFTSDDAWQAMPSSETASRLGSMVGRSDHSFLDHLTVQLNISAPHVIIPQDITDHNTSLVMVDLGNLTFETKSGSSRGAMNESNPDDDTLEEYDEDDEFATPPSSPPPEWDGSRPVLQTDNEYIMPSPTTPTLTTPITRGRSSSPKTSRNISYLLQLSDIQVLAGPSTSNWQDALTKGRSSLHLLDKFSLPVNLYRGHGNSESAKFTVVASLPLFHFHIDELKVQTLISCIHPPSELSLYPNPIERGNLPMSPNHSYLSQSSIGMSIYQSAYNVLDESHDYNVTDVLLRRQESEKKGEERKEETRDISIDLARRRLLHAQFSINELLVGVESKGIPLMEFKVVGVHGGVLQRAFDTAVKVLVEDVCVVDRIQSLGPKYELMVCSSGRRLVSASPEVERVGSPGEATPTHVLHLGDISVNDVFQLQVPFLLNLSLQQLSALSPDHPSSSPPVSGLYTAPVVGESERRQLSLQCTAIDVQANQQSVVELVSFIQRAIPSHLFSSGGTSPSVASEPSKPPVASFSPSSSPVTQISLEFEKLGLRLLRSGMDSLSTIGAQTYSIAEVELHGLGAEALFGAEVKIEGFLEGVHVSDPSARGRNYSNIMSLGSYQEFSIQDMVTTMAPQDSLSLHRASGVLSFTLTRTPSTSSQQHHDIHISAFVPAIHYTHSAHFVQQIELFVAEFSSYIAAWTESMKTAAVGMAKGFVAREKSKLSNHLERLSMSLGVSAHTNLGEQEGDEVDAGMLYGFEDHIFLDIKVKSPVVVVPASLSSQDTLVAHLGEIAVSSSYVNVGNEETSFSCESVDRLLVTITNMTLHSSHDQASRDWLLSEVDNEQACVSGRWNKIISETSFVLQIDRAVDGKNDDKDSGNRKEEEEVDVVISCRVPDSLVVLLPKEVFDQLKKTLFHGLYWPVHQPQPTSLSPHPPTSSSPSTTNTGGDLPRIKASFSLPRLTMSVHHRVGVMDRDVVTVSLDEFNLRCSKTSPFLTNVDVSLKSILVEDMLQPPDSCYRYILSSSIKPLHFPSPVTSPSLSTFRLGMTNKLSHQFIRLSQLASTPKPPVLSSPLRSFNPYPSTADLRESLSRTPSRDKMTFSLADTQDLVSVHAVLVSSDDPQYVTKYDSVMGHVDVDFSSVSVIVNLQTWVLLFDFLGIGIPTPPPSPSSPSHTAAAPTPLSPDDAVFSLSTDGSVRISPLRKDPVIAQTPEDEIRSLKSTVWGAEEKISVNIRLRVESLSVTFNKLEHPLARGVASGLKVDLNLKHGNTKLCGSVGQVNVTDLTETGAFYPERFTTTGDQALSFELFKFGRPDPMMQRPYDVSTNIRLSAVRYLHTMRFLKEIIAFCQHFPQLIDAFQRMKASAQGNLQYLGPDRKPRILIDVEAQGPMLLIPKHAFCPDIMGGVIGSFTVSNQFLYDGCEGTLTDLNRKREEEARIIRHQSTPVFGSHTAEQRGYDGRFNRTVSGSGLLDTTPSRSVVEEKRRVEGVWSTRQGPCLMDCMELLLQDVDVFSAKRVPLTGHTHSTSSYRIERDLGKCLKEMGSLKLLVERNLHEDFCRAVPDIHIDGTLSALHLMLDKRQLDTIKGLIDMNLGETVEEFEKESSVIQDPVAQPVAADVWTVLRFHVTFIDVQLEFLQSQSSASSHNRSLSLFDIQRSDFTFESLSNQTRSVNFTSQAVIGYDTRYKGYEPSAKPSVFQEVLRPHHDPHVATTKRSPQLEINVLMGPTQIKASILLNRLRLIGVFDLLQELKKFVVDKMPEEGDEDACSLGDEQSEEKEEDGVDEVDTIKEKEEKRDISMLMESVIGERPLEEKPDRDVRVSLSVTDTDFVIVEDLTSPSSNAVVLKGTLVLNFRSPSTSSSPCTLHCSMESLEMFSCSLLNEDETALSIVDPVTVGVELKPLATPSRSNSSSLLGTHTLEVDVRQFSVRLSYNDIKLFLAISQNMTAFANEQSHKSSSRAKSPVNEELVKKLLPLGYTRAAIMKELTRGGVGDSKLTSLLLQAQQQKDFSMDEVDEPKGITVKNIEVLVGMLNLCLIDDSLDHDVPLVEMGLSQLQASHQLLKKGGGSASCLLSLEYYNRSISSWEPIVEPWRLQCLWQESFAGGAHNKPPRMSFSITSQEQLCLNLTSLFLHLVQETNSNWQQDFLNDQDASRHHEQHLLRLNQLSSSSREDTLSSPPPVTNVQQGLTLLHSVRFISQTRQRNQFVPFVLHNSTGVPLQFSTLTSLPAKVLFNPTAILQQRTQSSTSMESMQPLSWETVRPGEEMPFDFASGRKLRHQDTRQLVVHQLRVKVEGWEEASVPVSVDKIGLFFRVIHPDTVQTHSHSNHPAFKERRSVRLVFAVSLKGTQKVVNVRSGLVLCNTLQLPLEVKLDPPSGMKVPGVSLPVLPAVGHLAVPLHLTHWEPRVRPQGWGLQFSSRSLSWQNTSSRATSNQLHECNRIGDHTEPPFRFCAGVSQKPFPPSNCSPPHPGHTITIHPPFTVANLLPFSFHFSFNHKEKLCPRGEEVAIHSVDPLRSITFTVTKLEGFVNCDECTVTSEDVGTLRRMTVTDVDNRPLTLVVTTELLGGCALKVSILCPYWLINHTGLPLVFRAEGYSNLSASQYEEHEKASSSSPLLFSYPEEDLLRKCQCRIGSDHVESGRPIWGAGFRMIHEQYGEVLRLFVKQNDRRPDREYQIGMEIQRGSRDHYLSRVVTFVARFQIENRTPFRIGYLQCHQLNGKRLKHSSQVPVMMPGAIMAFHWPRADLDQLLCIRVEDVEGCQWSGGFTITEDSAFHINMRSLYAQCVFVYCEVTQHGATYNVVLSNAADYPPPFKLENLSQVAVHCYQKGTTLDHHFSLLNPGQSVPYAWDEPTQPELLCLQVKGVSEVKEFDLNSFSDQGKVYYESYFYIVATTTTTSSGGTKEQEEFVLDVPQGTAVILTKKSLERRSQLWRMASDGQLVHISSSSMESSNQVLDIAGTLPAGRFMSDQFMPLVVAKMSSRYSTTQCWKFKDRRLLLDEFPFLCVQCRPSYDKAVVDGTDAVLGAVRMGGCSFFNRVKQSPGSGVLSVRVTPDGPTRVLHITDENKKYTFSSTKDDWIVVSHGVVAQATPTGVSKKDKEDEEDEKPQRELSISLSLEKGVGVSLINAVPEELLFASVSGIQVEFVNTTQLQSLNLTIQHIQVDNQMLGGYVPVMVFPSPPLSGQPECSYPVISCFVERIPHNSPSAIVFRSVNVKLREFVVFLEERLLFNLLQWAGLGMTQAYTPVLPQDRFRSMMQQHRSSSSTVGLATSKQLYIEQLQLSDTQLQVSVHTASQLPDDLQRLKRKLGIRLVQFQAPISLNGVMRNHMLGTPGLLVDVLKKHYKKVIARQAVKIVGSVDFLGNPTGLFKDVASGVSGVIALQPDVVGLVRDVSHGISDTTSKLTGAVSHVIGQATGDSSFLEEREQNFGTAQTSGDHFKAGLINFTSGIFGGMTSMITQPYKGAVEEGIGGFVWGIGKGVVGTVAKPISGLLDFATGTSAAVREKTSRVSRHIPAPMRLRRCCVGASGALSCYSEQLARGQEYLLRLNDGDVNEKLVSYERVNSGTDEMKVIISSSSLYFFQDSPPDSSSIESQVELDCLVECRATNSKTTIPVPYVVLSLSDLKEAGSPARVTVKKIKCDNPTTARKVTQLINYSKNLHEEEKLIVRTSRLQEGNLW